MKRLTTFTFLIAVVIVCVFAVRLYRPSVQEDKSHQIEFAAFPLNQPQTIDFARYPGETGTESAVQFREASYWNGYAKNSSGRREQLDQWRDWLLVTVVS